MPCYDPRDRDTRSVEEILRENAERILFHSAATPLLCEACSLLEHHRLLVNASPELQEFFRKHSQHDWVRIRDKYLSLRGQERLDYVASLTHREQVLLASAAAPE